MEPSTVVIQDKYIRIKHFYALIRSPRGLLNIFLTFTLQELEGDYNVVKPG